LKNRLYRPFNIFFVLTLWCANQAYSEGSRDLNASTHPSARRIYLSQGLGSLSGPTVNWYKITSQDSIEARNNFYVYAFAGERICLASSATGIGLGGIVLIRPDGTVALTDYSNLDGNGYIAAGAGSKNRERYGPYGIHNSGIGGYIPVEFVADQTGIYIVQFGSPNPGSGSSNVGPPQPLTTADFAQPINNTVISAFDVTILTTGGAPQSGRLFANYLSLTAGAGSAMQFFDLNVMTREGYRYQMSFRALQPYGYFIYTDNVGLQLSDGVTPSYESVRYQPTVPNNRRIMVPDIDPETAFETKHKIFFNIPDPSMPASATLNNTNTWLNPVLNTSTYYVNVTYSNTGMPNVMAGTLQFNIPNFGVRYKMQIDLNNNGVFQESTDITINGATSVGLNVVNWDGLDGQGNVVAAGCFNVKLDFIAGEMHVPLADAENFRGGIRIRRLNGNGVLPNDTIHWNDLTLLDNTETPAGSYLKRTPPEGTSSSIDLPIDTTIRRWESVAGATIRATHTIGYGDVRYMDQWAYDTLSTNVFTPLACYGVLPEAGLDLSARRNGSVISLDWHAQQQTQEDQEFTIEKSEDGTDFSVIHTVVAAAGQRTFNWLDKSTTPEKNYYYRIRWQDRSGNNLYSRTLKINAINPGRFIQRMYPIPVNDVLNLVLAKSSKQYIYRIADQSGRMVKHGTIHDSAQINVTDLSAGVYWLAVTAPSGDQIIEKILVARQ
jgi:Secretion system C-terminal sorting domain